MYGFRLFKYPALVLLSSSSFLPFSKNFRLQDFDEKKEKNISTYPSAKKSERLDEFLTENNLKRFFKLERARQRLDHKSFVENGVLKMNGFEIFNIYLPDLFLEKVSKLEEITDDEKQTIGKLYLVFKTNENLQGHHGITHGGLVATIVDSTLGQFAAIMNDYKATATANFNLNYRKPILVGKEYILIAELDKKQGRNIYLKCKIINTEKEVFLDGTLLFLGVNWEKNYSSSLFHNLLNPDF